MKKITTLLLTAILLIGITACGDNGDNSNNSDNSNNENTPTENLQSNIVISGDFGEIIEFGGVNWLVLDKRDGKALIISEAVICIDTPYNVNNADVTWETCTLREYLNDEFYNSFSEADKARIVETTIVNGDNPEYGTPGGNNTTDKIFLLSIAEANSYFADKSARIAFTDEGEAVWWGLRSPGSNSSAAALVEGNGNVFDMGIAVYLSYESGGVRPALWLSL